MTKETKTEFVKDIESDNERQVQAAKTLQNHVKDFKRIDTRTLKTKIAQGIKKRNEYQNFMHEIAMQCYAYVFIDRNTVPALEMYNALKEVNKTESDQFLSWLRTHTLVKTQVTKSDGKTFVINKRKEEEGFEYNPSAANNAPYFTVDIQEETVKRMQEFGKDNALQSLQKVQDKIHTLLEKGEIENKNSIVTLKQGEDRQELENLDSALTSLLQAYAETDSLAA